DGQARCPGPGAARRLRLSVRACRPVTGARAHAAPRYTAAAHTGCHDQGGPVSPNRGSALPQRGVDRRLGNWLWVTAFVGFFLVFGAWAAAMPPHAAFDEQPHVIRAAGASAGQIVPRVVNGESVQTVPRGYDTSLCFIGKPGVSAACLGPFAGAERVELQTSAGRYFPLYYVVVGWPLNVWPGWTGLLAARLISAALSAAFLAGALVTLVRRSR